MKATKVMKDKFGTMIEPTSRKKLSMKAATMVMDLVDRWTEGSLVGGWLRWISPIIGV